jgi:hypothetical protein
MQKVLQAVSQRETREVRHFFWIVLALAVTEVEQHGQRELGLVEQRAVVIQAVVAQLVQPRVQPEPGREQILEVKRLVLALEWELRGEQLKRTHASLL